MRRGAALEAAPTPAVGCARAVSRLAFSSRQRARAERAALERPAGSSLSALAFARASSALAAFSAAALRAEAREAALSAAFAGKVAEARPSEKVLAPEVVVGRALKGAEVRREAAMCML